MKRQEVRSEERAANATKNGDGVISLKLYPSIGAAEKAAVAEVLDSGCLSGFHGSPGPQFLGGPKVRAFEEAWAAHCGVKHAVSVNSATSGLLAAMAAIGIEDGDEVILPPWTMSATAAAPKACGATLVFADIERETYCIDPVEVEKKITKRTRAIIAVNLFGHPARLAELRALADSHRLWLIEDSAQAPLAFENGRRAGTVGHIGVFSFNYHKHIHTGEGGMCVTNDDRLAERMRRFRNHGENVSDEIGFNLRMTEIEAAIGLCQLARIEEHVGARVRLARMLTEAVRDTGIKPPKVREGCTSNHYLWAFSHFGDVARFSSALAAEGFPHTVGYVTPLYRLPAFKTDAVCPVVESLGDILTFETCAYAVDDAQALRLGQALRNAWGTA